MPTAPESPAPESPVARVLGHANDVHLLARRCGRDDLAAVLAAEAGRWPDEAVTVVVAGAQKRGKSRLVNALVDRPELLPVDIDIATHTYLSLRRGPVLTATVLRRVDGEPQRIPVRVDEIDDYASAQGDPVKRRDVAGVEITMEHPLLEGVRVIDTPGVDSLTLGHRHATMAILQEADVLLFAVSAQDQPVLRHELEFLAEAAERIQAVAFVLTKVEDSTSAEALLAENRRRLAEFVARHADGVHTGLNRLTSAPWIPVSAKLAEAAAARAALGQADRAEQLRERSGFNRLNAYLRACAEGRELARCGRVLSASGSVLRAVAAAEEDRIAAGSQNGEAVEERQRQLDRHLSELADRARVRQRFSVDQQFLSREISSLVRVRLEEIRRAYEQAVTELTTRAQIESYLAELPESVERSLEAARTEVIAQARERAAVALTELLAALRVDPIDIELATIAMPEQTRARLAEGAPLADRARVDLIREGIPAASMAASLGMLMAHVVGLGAAAIAWPVAVVVGPALAAGVLWRRRQVEQASRDQAAVKRAITDVFGAAAAELTLAIERAVTSWRLEVERAIDEALAQERRDLDTRRAEIARLAGADATARRDATQRAKDRMASVTTLRTRAEALQKEITAGLRLLG